jgi:hypothetical protein
MDLHFVLRVRLLNRGLKLFAVRYISLFNAGIKSLRATLPAEIFYWGF